MKNRMKVVRTGLVLNDAFIGPFQHKNEDIEAVNEAAKQLETIKSMVVY